MSDEHLEAHKEVPCGGQPKKEIWGYLKQTSMGLPKLLSLTFYGVTQIQKYGCWVGGFLHKFSHVLDCEFENLATSSTGNPGLEVSINDPPVQDEASEVCFRELFIQQILWIIT